MFLWIAAIYIYYLFNKKITRSENLHRNKSLTSTVSKENNHGKIYTEHNSDFSKTTKYPSRFEFTCVGVFSPRNKTISRERWMQSIWLCSRRYTHSPPHAVGRKVRLTSFSSSITIWPVWLYRTSPTKHKLSWIDTRIEIASVWNERDPN